jgi:hypothetical protein
VSGTAAAREIEADERASAVGELVLAPAGGVKGVGFWLFGAEMGYERRVSNHVNLTTEESSLIDETAPHALDGLDAQELKKLQSRLRTARDKNFSLLRREGAARVEAEGGRGAAAPTNEKRSDKVDVFDEALARVAARLDAVAD